MTNQVKDILERVLTWPPERQKAAARLLTEMEEQDASPYRLSDEQVQKVEKRLANQNRKLIDFDVARKRLVDRSA